MVVDAFNPSRWISWVQDYPGLHSEYQDSQSYHRNICNPSTWKPEAGGSPQIQSILEMDYKVTGWESNPEDSFLNFFFSLWQHFLWNKIPTIIHINITFIIEENYIPPSMVYVVYVASYTWSIKQNRKSNLKKTHWQFICYHSKIAK